MSISTSVIMAHNNTLSRSRVVCVPGRSRYILLFGFISSEHFFLQRCFHRIVLLTQLAVTAQISSLSVDPRGGQHDCLQSQGAHVRARRKTSSFVQGSNYGSPCDPVPAETATAAAAVSVLPAHSSKHSPRRPSAPGIARASFPGYVAGKWCFDYLWVGWGS